MLVPAQSAREPPTARRARSRRRLRLLRRDRLHRIATQDAAPSRLHAKPVDRPHLHGASPGHDARRAGQRAARRSHGRSRFTSRLAGAGDRAAAAGTAAARRAGATHAARRRRAASPTPPPLPVRRYRTPHTVFPHAQFLSNGRLVSVVTNAGGGSLLRDDLAVTRARRDATLDPGSLYIYLRDVWSGDVWSAAYHPTAVEPDEYLATFRPDRATIRRRDGTIVSQLDIAVSTEDDVEVRRLSITNQGPRIARDRRDELRRARARRAGRRPGAPGVRQAVSRNRIPAGQLGAALSSAPARSCRRPDLGHARAQSRRPDAGADRMGNRSRAVPRPWPRSALARRARRPAPVRHHRRRARSDLQSASAHPARARRDRAAVVCDRRRRRSRRRAGARAEVPRPERRDARVRARRSAHAQSALHHLAISNDDALLFERLASRVLFADGSLRAPARRARPQPARSAGPVAAQHLRRSADSARARHRRRRAAARPAGPAGAGVLAAEGPPRRRRHPQRRAGRLPGRMADAADGAARCGSVARVAAAAGRRRTSCAATTSPAPSARCSKPSARAVLSGDRGDLRGAARSAVRRSGVAAAARPGAERARRTQCGGRAGRRHSRSPVPPLTFANGLGGFADDGRAYVIVLDGDGKRRRRGRTSSRIRASARS